MYFERYAYGPPLFPAFLPSDETELIVVIPSYRETELVQAVSSLALCDDPGFKVLILVVINEPEKADEHTVFINDVSAKQLDQLKLPYFLELVVHKTKFPTKKAGVGLARKLGMDEAARWYNQLNKDGVITCYDSDCNCDPDFFNAIYTAFNKRKLEAGVIFYEHPLTNTEIVQYELFLRYHVDSLRFAHFPHAFQTLGSCISVRSSTYQKHGGMNTRKAGEDFYFLHKIIPHCRFEELNHTTIYPSPRESDRVPFGTGIALTKIAKLDQYLVYAPESFLALKAIFTKTEQLYRNEAVILPESIQMFLEENQFNEALKEMRRNVSNLESFRKRFFTWWDAFRALKYVHYARDNHYPNIPLTEAIQWLDENFWNLQLNGTLKEKLIDIRSWDRSYKTP